MKETYQTENKVEYDLSFASFLGGRGGGAYLVSAAVRQKFKELITYSKETIEIEITETKKKPSSRTDSVVVEL